MMPNLESSKYELGLQGYKTGLVMGLQNPMNESVISQGTPRFDQNGITELTQTLVGVNEIMLMSTSMDQQQSSHLTNVIDITQHTRVKYSNTMLWQSQINNINTNILTIQPHSFTNQTDHTDHMDQYTHTQTTQPIVSHIFRSLLKSKQQSSKHNKQTITLQQPINYEYTPRTHNCTIQETHNKPRIPKRYRSIESHYSPKQLQVYLNKDHPNYQMNSKWLNYGTKSQKHENRNVCSKSQDGILAHFTAVGTSRDSRTIQQLKESLQLKTNRAKHHQLPSQLISMSRRTNLNNQSTTLKNEELQQIQDHVMRLSKRLSHQYD